MKEELATPPDAQERFKERFDVTENLENFIT